MYILKLPGMHAALVRRRPRGHVPKKRVPDWAQFTLLTFALAWLLIAGWSFGLRLLHKNLMAAVEASSRVPAEEFRESVNESLALAFDDASAGNWPRAASEAEDASSEIRAARLHGLVVGPEVFEEISAALDRFPSAPSASAAPALFNARLELAELRSTDERSLEPPGAAGLPLGVAWQNPASVTATRALAMGERFTPASIGAAVLDASQWDAANCSRSHCAEFFSAPQPPLFVNDARVRGMTLAAGTQTLDGIHWSHVAFVGANVRYEGGEVELRRVRFIECEFDFAPGARSARLLEAIADGAADSAPPAPPVSSAAENVSVVPASAPPAAAVSPTSGRGPVTFVIE